MYPFLPWSQQNPASLRSSPSEASPTTDNMYYGASFGDSIFGSGSPSSLMPPPPPPSPSDNSLLDITPRKSSFSQAFGMSNACAFPSWPNRASLITSDSEGSTASAYLSDEDLYPIESASPEHGIDEESAAQDPTFGAHDLTTEQQIQMLRAAAEEEAQRALFLAKVQAHARAQQALRVAQLAAAEKENAKRKKHRTVSDSKKRRTISPKNVSARA